ncbi:hypothetical protein [Paenibacillus sp. CF384]|uniref:hypothetical protein n=1 Tax=Paenibacillus sp. CF384 TaxID=1884382 RepID=UPI000897E5A5|nr:hypothetical protein [Paenibacillus sp. CF384]SDX57597.1 hypothetical protein SAMN05518855_1016155 [Paenibacillus sp. CF384]
MGLLYNLYKSMQEMEDDHSEMRDQIEIADTPLSLIELLSRPIGGRDVNEVAPGKETTN